LIRDAFRVLRPGHDDFVLAGNYIRHYATGLRTADALHLAIARNHGADLVLSLDDKDAESGNDDGRSRQQWHWGRRVICSRDGDMCCRRMNL
jgi:predicted nucleic acid-binding protein